MSDQHSSTKPSPPESTAVREALQNHHEHFDDVSGEIALQQLETEQGLKRQYSGRVLYELLQNALDSADSEILVELTENPSSDESEYALVVANDGDELTVAREYNYDIPPENRDGQRPDFNALCSIRTSNKSADESVGNKGIGFRSTFAVGRYARVWSRFERRPGWWGIELHLPLDSDTWNRRLRDPEVQRGHESFLETKRPRLTVDEQRPSFHFPLPLKSDEAGTPLGMTELDGLTTAVVVPIEADQLEHLRDSFRELQANHLYFLGLFEDRRDITVQFETPDLHFERTTWPPNQDTPTHSLSYWRTAELEELARQADLEISNPGAAIAWPTEQRLAERRETDSEARLYGYLPTAVPSPFEIDIHADFQLRVDRTGVQLDDDLVGPYNRALLKIGAELHLLSVCRHIDLSPDRIDWAWIEPDEITSTTTADSTDPRADIWRLLDSRTRSDAGDVVVDHVQDRLFPHDDGEDPGTYQLWAELAARFFDSASGFPLETYETFWDVSKYWVDRICPHSERSKTWRRTVTALCDAVRESEARVVPIADDTESDRYRAVPLPERGSAPTGGNRQRHSRVVFVRDSDDKRLPLPEPLWKADRAVTTFQFHSSIIQKSPQPLGTRPFNRWEVLSELRQIPNSQPDWEPEPLADDPETAFEHQRALLEFAVDLYRYQSRGGGMEPAEVAEQGPGWRVLDTAGIGDTARRAGRAIATLYLPTTEGLWEPARQLTRDAVDVSRLGELHEEFDDDALNRFLTFLGVGPEQQDGPPLTLIEGGSDGRVPAREVPPRLAEAGAGSLADLSLGCLPASDEDSFSPESWRNSLSNVWDEWLSTLLQTETAARENEDPPLRTSLLEPLSNRPWYPVDGEGYSATSPGVRSDDVDAIPPRSLTLLSTQQKRFPRVLWSVDDDTPDRELLVACGAIDGVDTDTLEQNGSEPAFRVLSQLREGFTLETVTGDRVARSALVDLFDRILEAVVAIEDHETQPVADLQLLCYEPESEPVALSDRDLTWTPWDEADAWIVSDSSDREIMRRFFPQESLVAATIGPQNLSGYEPLEDRGVEIEDAVDFEPLSAGTPDQSTHIEESLEEIVPKLLALAEASLQIDIDGDAAVTRWQAGNFVHVDNAWFEYRVVLEDRRTIENTWRKDSTGDAFFDDGDRPAIRFDTPDGGSPPLPEFGEPLSALLFEEQRQDVDSLFARALSEYEGANGEARLSRFVEKTDAEPLVAPYERIFDPPANEMELLSQTDAALATLGFALAPHIQSAHQLPNLDPADLTVDDGDAPAEESLTESTINDVLGAVGDDAESPFTPEFRCRDEHHREWESWWEDNRDRFRPYLTHLLHADGDEEMEPDDVERSLEEFVSRNECPRLDFDPQRAVYSWVRTTVDDAELMPSSGAELVEEVRRFAPDFEPVTRAPRTGPSERAWNRPGEIGSPSSPDSEGGTFDHADAIERMRRQSAVGDDAERSFRPAVAEWTRECLEAARREGRLDEARELLVGPFARDGETAKHILEGVDTWAEHGDVDALERGVHVSEVWDGAGFDLIGLEPTTDGWEVVRYEVKALPDGEAAAVHLSSNQFAVYRDVCLDPDAESDPKHRGEWKLIGVEPDNGEAEDLTAELSDLPEYLEQLRSGGFGHDGIVIHLRRADR
jgi:hypothetical protein